MNELNIALAIEEHSRSYDDLDLENKERFNSSVRNLCGLFISIVDQKIYLIHQTAKDFLIAKTEALTDQWKHSIKPVESDLLMARACITYLQFTVFNDGSDSPDDGPTWLPSTGLHATGLRTEDKRRTEYLESCCSVFFKYVTF